VGAWISCQLTEVGGQPGFDVRVCNSNSVPVYQVAFVIDVGGLGRFARRIPQMGPNETREFHIDLSDSPPGPLFYAPELTFTDALGLRWYRSPRGELRELSLDEALADRFWDKPLMRADPNVHFPEGDEWFSGGRIVG